MNNGTIIKKIWKNSRRLLLVASCLLAFTFGWQGNLFSDRGVASAATLESSSPLLADLGGSGLKNQIEGRAQQDIGRTQSAIDRTGDKLEKAGNRAAGKADAASKQIEGRAKQDIGRTQDALQDAGNNAEDTAEGAFDAIKGFFGQ